jgi:hypothetical protein
MSFEETRHMLSVLDVLVVSTVITAAAEPVFK